jgi:non-specific serine/threonine protein kinase
MKEGNGDNTRTHVVLTSGKQVHHYRIVEQIGAGGMGEVYLAEDSKLNRRVAMKFLPAHLVSNEEIRTRFVREAQTLAKVNHPNIVSIYDVSDFEGRPFYVMELVEGESLHHYAHKTPLSIDTIVEYAIQICQGLSEAHRAGIVHRDIKSANIAVDRQGRIRLLDFGLAAVAGDDKITKTGSTLGTVAYMSPEQVSGRGVDHRSDLFSLGVVLYELLAGTTPFKRTNEGATLKAIMEDTPQPVTRYRAEVPEQLQAIISELLEKDREIRYQSAEGVIAHLKRLMYDSRPPAPSSELRRPLKRRLLPMAAAALVIIAVSAWAVFFRGVGAEADRDLPVLAVIPFENLGSAEDDYFSEGITDEIRSRLTTISGIRVISRNSAEKYKGSDKTVDEIGRDLGADYLLGATIRWDKSGEVERIRITPHLTQTENSYQMWSDVYEQDLTQIFEVQAAIADQIVGQLGLTFTDPKQLVKDEAPTDNIDAYNYYLRGLEISREGIFMSNYAGAIAMFDSAVRLDPEFAQAWAQKSIASSNQQFSSLSMDNVRFRDEAKRAAERALALDPQLPIGHIALGTYYNWIETDYDRALAEFSKAEREITSNADLSEAIGVVKMRQGKWGEALDKFAEASRIDPLNNQRYFWLATCNTLIRDYSAADRYINRTLALSPGNVDAVFYRFFIELLEHGRIGQGTLSMLEEMEPSERAAAFSWEVGGANAQGLWRFMPEGISTGDERREALRGLREELSEGTILMGLGELFSLDGQDDSALVFFDSARIALSQLALERPDDFGVFGALGVAYARLGMKEEAIAAGLKSKELMTIERCHW